MNAKEFLETKNIYSLDTKKRYQEVVVWMEQYADYRVKNNIVLADVSGECLHPYNAVRKDKITELCSCSICEKVLANISNYRITETLACAQSEQIQNQQTTATPI